MLYQENLQSHGAIIKANDRATSFLIFSIFFSIKIELPSITKKVINLSYLSRFSFLRNQPLGDKKSC